MKEVKNDIIKKYKYEDKYEGYVIYIKETKDAYESYLQNEKYGVIDLIIGVFKENTTLEQLEKIISYNIENYIKIYKQCIED